MLVLEAKNLTYSIGERRLLEIEKLQIAAGARIGLIGANGAGKSTLLAILAGELSPESGQVRQHLPCWYLRQLGQEFRVADRRLGRRFKAPREAAAHLSGGEKARGRLAEAMERQAPLLLADEPGVNLDMDGLQLLAAELKSYPGAVVLVAHDRQLLDAVVDTIWLLEDGRLSVYVGNYTAFTAQRAAAATRQQKDYETYCRTQAELLGGIADRRQRSAKTRRAPARMGNSEARLHKMGDQRAKHHLDQAVRAMESRLEQLTPVERPHQERTLCLDMLVDPDFHSRILVEGRGVTCRFGEAIVLQNLDFRLERGRKVALLGPNGSGKSTLLQRIQQGGAGIRIAPGLRLGYFRQEAAVDAGEQSLLTFVLAASRYPESFCRTLLARLLFPGNSVHKPLAVLSGGERVRAELARLMLSGVHALLLDEVTNYLDMPSRQAVEDVLAEWEGSLLLVTHDRALLARVAQEVWLLEAGRLTVFAGTYDEYLAHTAHRREAPAMDAALWRHRVDTLLSQLSVCRQPAEKAALEAEYTALLAKRPE